MQADHLRAIGVIEVTAHRVTDRRAQIFEGVGLGEYRMAEGARATRPPSGASSSEKMTSQDGPVIVASGLGCQLPSSLLRSLLPKLDDVAPPFDIAG